MPARHQLSTNRQLGVLLRELRKKANLSQSELAYQLNCNQSKVARMETAERSLDPHDLNRLLVAVDATAKEREEVQALVREKQDVSLVRLNAAAQQAMKAMVGDHAPGPRVDATASAAVIAYHQALQQEADQDQAGDEAATIGPAPEPGGRRD